jgi:hypothetical protein
LRILYQRLWALTPALYIRMQIFRHQGPISSLTTLAVPPRLLSICQDELYCLLSSPFADTGDGCLGSRPISTKSFHVLSSQLGNFLRIVMILSYSGTRPLSLDNQMVSPLRACRIIILFTGAGCSKTKHFPIPLEKGSFVDLHGDILDDDAAIRVGPGWLIHSTGLCTGHLMMSLSLSRWTTIDRT